MKKTCHWKCWPGKTIIRRTRLWMTPSFACLLLIAVACRTKPWRNLDITIHVVHQSLSHYVYPIYPPPVSPSQKDLPSLSPDPRHLFPFPAFSFDLPYAFRFQLLLLTAQ